MIYSLGSWGIKDKVPRVDAAFPLISHDLSDLVSLICTLCLPLILSTRKLLIEVLLDLMKVLFSFLSPLTLPLHYCVVPNVFKICKFLLGLFMPVPIRLTTGGMRFIHVKTDGAPMPVAAHEFKGGVCQWVIPIYSQLAIPETFFSAIQSCP